MMSNNPERRGPTRREFLALGVGAFVVASVPLAARRRDRLVRRTLPVMGTIAEFAVVHGDPLYAHAAIDAAMSELRRIETLMTRFTTTSDIGRANLGAAGSAVLVSAETALVVGEALRWADASGGAYDPAIGEAVQLWDVTHRHTPPAERDVHRIAGRQLHRTVEVGRHAGSSALVYHDRDVAIDLGAIAKGYAVDRAIAVLREWKIARAVVDVGGDLYALGTAADGEPWRIGIQDPNDERGLLETFSLADAAAATSGTYVQYFRYRGVRYHHLIDPDTGAPRRTPVQSLTIRADSCMHADVAATALFGMPVPDANRLLNRCAPGGAVVRSV